MINVSKAAPWPKTSFWKKNYTLVSSISCWMCNYNRTERRWARRKKVRNSKPLRLMIHSFKVVEKSNILQWNVVNLGKTDYPNPSETDHLRGVLSYAMLCWTRFRTLMGELMERSTSYYDLNATGNQRILYTISFFFYPIFTRVNIPIFSPEEERFPVTIYISPLDQNDSF